MLVDHIDLEAIMGFFKALVTHLSPIFLITSPLTSYVDQIYSMHKNRSSAGFSLDLPLIMLVASITKIYYWFGVHYDTSLLIQAVIMVIVQIVVLHVALTNRPLANTAKDLSIPFASATSDASSNIFDKRPYQFWQWRTARPYWQFLLYFTLGLGALQVLLGSSSLYVNFIGYFALAVEATLPVPQVISNQRNRSCKGFRLSVIANWLFGDVMKMAFFFLSDTTIPWAFKLCGLFQFACDIYLGMQYAQFGEGPPSPPQWQNANGKSASSG